MALHMNALFHFDCSRHKKFKNIALKGLWELYAATVGWMDGWDGTGGSHHLDSYDYQSTCGAKKGVVVAVKGVLFIESSDNTMGPRRCETFDIANIL